MCFEKLNTARERGELILIDGGMCRYHLRKDKQITIYTILSTRPGAGTEMLEVLKRVEGADSIFAKCPVDLVANHFYRKRGFVLEGIETATGRREVNLWRLALTR